MLILHIARSNIYAYAIKMIKSKLFWQAMLLVVVAITVSYCGGQGGGSPAVPPAVLTPPWTTKLLAPTLREYAASVVINDEVYVLGGQLTGVVPPGPATDAVEIYNPVTGIWRAGLPMPTARMGLVAVVAGGKIYAIGGRTDSLATSAVATVEQFDPATGLWTTRNPMSVPRYFAAGAMLPTGIGDHIVVAGGESSGSLLGAVEEYNPVANAWVNLNPLAIARGGLALAQSGGKLYAIGGHAVLVPQWVGTVEEFDPGTGNWATRAAMPTAREHTAIAVVGGKLLVAGGSNANPSLATLESYDPTTNLWSAKTSSTTVFTRAVAGVVNGKVYVFGSALSLKYDPANELL